MNDEIIHTGYDKMSHFSLPCVLNNLLMKKDNLQKFLDDGFYS